MFSIVSTCTETNANEKCLHLLIADQKFTKFSQTYLRLKNMNKVSQDSLQVTICLLYTSDAADE